MNRHRLLVILVLTLGTVTAAAAAERDLARMVRHEALQFGDDALRAAVDLVIERGMLPVIARACHESQGAARPSQTGGVDVDRVKALAVDLVKSESTLIRNVVAVDAYPDDRGDDRYNPIWAVVVRYSAPESVAPREMKMVVLMREIYVRVDSWKAASEYKRLAL